MAFKRTAIPFFELANNAYVSAQVTFFQVDTTTWTPLTTLVTLYSSKTGAVTVSNPLTLDGDGKFATPVYTDQRFIAVVTSIDGQSHTTGIFEPALSDADVAASAASAAAAAASETNAALSATSASVSQVAAAASAAAAQAAVGTVYAGPTDVTLGRLDTKTGAGTAIVLTQVGGVLQIGVTTATNVQALAKVSVTTVLTPGNLAALVAGEATTGLVRFATAAEVTTGTVSTAAVTPLALGNTLTVVTAVGGSAYTEVTSGASPTMAAFARYRFTATTAATANLKNTLTLGDFHIVEFACTTAATMTVGLNGNTSIDGTAASDTCNRYGDVIQYFCPTAAGVVKTKYIGSLPTI